jgi:hypothetical protein
MKEAKTDIPGLYKTSEGFLINKDNNALAAYKAKRSRDQELHQLKEEVTSMKSDLTEIKELLKGLVK